MKLDLGAGDVSPDGFIPLGNVNGTQIYPLACRREQFKNTRGYAIIPSMLNLLTTPHELPAVQGVYVIQNVITGMRYVGSSHDVRARAIGHLNKLVKQKHANRYLQAAWNVDGDGAFMWGLLETVHETALLASAEGALIKSLASGYGQAGYNLVLNPSTGTLAADVRKRMSEKRKGRPAWNKGVPCPEHVKAAIKRLLTGRVKGNEEVAKIRAAMLGPSHPHRGKRLTPETCQKLSARARSAGPLGGGFKGVNFDARTQTYMSRIFVGGRQMFLGRYGSAVEAAQAYNLVALQHFGANCFLNDVPAGKPVRCTRRGRPAMEVGHG